MSSYSFTEAAFLGLVQAVTEFLPVSSDGHLALANWIMNTGSDDTAFGLLFTVTLHIGTVLATILFLWSDIKALVMGLFGSPDRRFQVLRMAFVIIIGSIPAAIVGLSLRNFIEDSFFNPLVFGSGFLVTSLFLEVAYRTKRSRQKSLASSDEGRPVTHRESVIDWPIPTTKQALMIGLAQSLAILPGVSRSGTTISTGLLLGMKPETAVRFSFLLSLPAIIGAELLEVLHFQSATPIDLKPLALGLACAAVGGFFALKLLVRMVRDFKLRIFSVYTLALGILVLGVAILNP